MHIRIVDYRPPRIALILIFMALLLHWLTPLSREYVYSNTLVGYILGVGGFAVMIWGWWLFKKFDTAICPTAQTNNLVTSGIYKLTRNPMYLGMVAMLLAIALNMGSAPFYAAAIVYFTILNFVFCPYEEQKLLNSFGDDYLMYKNKVRRWI